MSFLILAGVVLAANFLVAPAAARIFGDGTNEDDIEATAKMWVYLLAFSIVLGIADHAGAFA